MQTDLIQAADAGDLDAVRRLLADGAAVDAQDARGRTALLAATQGNHIAVAAALIAAGADVNEQDHGLDSAFLYAGAAGFVEVLRLAAKTADTTVTNRYGGTALIPACERGHVETVEFLVTETGTDVNHVNNLGWTALLEAIILSDGGARHQRIVELLIRHGADVQLADRNGVTPLAHAKSRGYDVIGEMLEAAGGP